jgi:hypothetical protein
MSAAEVNLNIEKGTSFKYAFSYLENCIVPVDMTDYALKAQLKESYNSKLVWAEWSTANGKISVNQDGKILISLSPFETETYNFYHAVYDIFLISPDNEVTKLIKGFVTVEHNVTSITQ